MSILSFMMFVLGVSPSKAISSLLRNPGDEEGGGSKVGVNSGGGEVGQEEYKERKGAEDPLEGEEETDEKKEVVEVPEAPWDPKGPPPLDPSAPGENVMPFF